MHNGSAALVLGVGLLADPQIFRHLFLGEIVLFSQVGNTFKDIGVIGEFFFCISYILTPFLLLRCCA